ncbi:hypothetical protein [Sporosarcina sp. UB5]|uniref:hypothetical protein n=1 Tax=Sporosarcina sp. UB5 TaxID=3047463 RepID=UPI003D795505
MTNRNSRWKTGLAILLITICLVNAGCSKSEAQDQIKESIKTVVELQMNAPDERAILKDEPTSSHEEEGFFDAYNKYLEEEYAPYFTVDAFERYILTSELVTFQWAANRYDYQLKVNEVSVEQNEVTPTNYNFTVNLDYVNKDGETTTIELTGVAIMRDDKIAKISYLGDKQLIRSLLDGGLK